MRRLILLTACLLLPSAAFPQGVPVIDLRAILQRARLIEQARRTLEETTAGRELLDLLRRKLGPMQQFRMPTLTVPSHDLTRYPVGGDFLGTLNAGNADGSNYGRLVVHLPRDLSVLDALAPEARTELRAIYGAVEVADAVATNGAHQVGITRGYAGHVSQQIDALQDAVTDPDPNQHELTQNAGKIAAGSLVARRQDMVTNQLLDALLDQRVSENLAARNAEAAWMQARIGQLLNRGRAQAALTGSAGAAVRRRWWAE